MIWPIESSNGDLRGALGHGGSDDGARIISVACCSVLG